jgi:hypothetical protein
MDGFPTRPARATPRIRDRPRRMTLLDRLATFAADALRTPASAPAPDAARRALPRGRYEVVAVRAAEDLTGAQLPDGLAREISGRLAERLAAAGLHVDGSAGARGPAAAVTPRLLACGVAGNGAGGEDGAWLLTVAIDDLPTGHAIDEPVLHLPPGAGRPSIAELADAAARLVRRRLLPGAWSAGAGGPGLTDITHPWEPAEDPDVALFTNVTLNDRVPARIDARGREVATLTLYQVDPPLSGLGRGPDMDDPVRLVRTAFANQLSTVATDDAAAMAVPAHPIGHFFIRLEIPGQPTVLTGMTTTARADVELAALTIGRRLGIGGILLTPEPGRLNSAAEALRELALRQRRLRVTDGLPAPGEAGSHVVEDGHVVFARFRLPVVNAMDALDVLRGFVRRGQHGCFGALDGRPHLGTGAGCSAFAMAFLAASGVLPFVDEPPPAHWPRTPAGIAGVWRHTIDVLRIPLHHVGRDERSGAERVVEAGITFYDLLFHRADRRDATRILLALEPRIRARYGALAARLFGLAARTRLRDLAIARGRKDPHDHGDYGWAPPGQGLEVTYWSNARFAAWVRGGWRNGGAPCPTVAPAREGRFLGIEIDAMAAPRRRGPFFLVPA